jgi:hypothetical protein
MAIKLDPKELDEQYNLDKASIVRNWFFVGAELAKLKKGYPSTKLFGQAIAKTDFASIENHDRSTAIWMFENWRDILNWVEVLSERAPSDPFGYLGSRNCSHPAHIKRQFKVWQQSQSL